VCNKTQCQCQCQGIPELIPGGLGASLHKLTWRPAVNVIWPRNPSSAINKTGTPSLVCSISGFLSSKFIVVLATWPRRLLWTNDILPTTINSCFKQRPSYTSNDTVDTSSQRYKYVELWNDFINNLPPKSTESVDARSVSDSRLSW